MGIRITQAPSTSGAMDSTGNEGNANTRGPRRVKYVLVDLPIPHNRVYTDKWHKQFVPNLLAWAGSLEDPFGTNGQLTCGEIVNLWNKVFPEVVLGHGSKDLAIVQSVVCALTRTEIAYYNGHLVRECPQQLEE